MTQYKRKSVFTTDTRSPFNKSNNSKKVGGIHCTYRKSIDRIQLSIRNKMGIFNEIEDKFKREFEYIGTKKVKGGRFIYQFIYQDSLIELFTYKIGYWFSISIQDAGVEVQRAVLKILEPLLHIFESEYSISQVEFTVDFLPINSDAVDALKDRIDDVLVRRYSRKGDYRQYKTTTYQGLRGNVRAGSKGLTCYTKEKICAVRVELRANKALLKRHGIFSLPVRPVHLRIADYVDIREGLNNDSFEKLFRFILKKRRVPEGKLAQKVQQVFLYKYLYRGFVREEHYYRDFEESITKPIAAQIDFFRQLREEFNIKYQPGYFFPEQQENPLSTL